MKKLFTLTFLLLAVITVQGQQIIYQEDFENFQGYQFLGWPAQINSAYAYPWETGPAIVIGGFCFEAEGNNTRVAGLKDNFKCNQCQTCSGTFGDSMVTLVTPPIAFASVSGAWLSFDSYFKGTEKNGVQESATVLVSTDGGTTWDEVYQVTPVASLGFEPRYVNLNGYSGQNSIQLGFRYGDGGGHMSGWMIDNLTIFTPTHKDLALRSISPVDSLLSYKVINTGMLHTFEVFNKGLDTITTYMISYQQGGQPVHQHTVSGAPIPPFHTVKLVHPFPDTLAVANDAIVHGWVTLASDANTSDNDASTLIHGAYFMPQKRLVIEEGTSTRIGNAPEGMTLMTAAAGTGIPLSLISCHGGDTMSIKEYSDFLYSAGDNFLPYLLFDRRQRVKAELFSAALDNQKNYFGFADISTSMDLVNDELVADIAVTPALDMPGNYSLGLILTENNVHSADAAYNQANAYAGGLLGPMGGYENRPDPVPAADMYYNNVARLTYPKPGGETPDWPAVLISNTPYQHRFQVPLSGQWSHDHLFATVVLIRDADSVILNSQRLDWSLSVRSNHTAEEWSAGIYPNPASDRVTLFFEADGSDYYGWFFQDVSGRTLSAAPAQTYPAGRINNVIPVTGLASGIYFLTAYSEHSRKTFKLQVIGVQ